MAILDDKYKDSVKDMDFDITMDLSVQVLSQGSTHSSDYLSHGYRDLVGLCARFALVDVLYHKEQRSDRTGRSFYQFRPAKRLRMP